MSLPKLSRIFILREIAHLSSCFSFLREHWAIYAAQGQFLAVSVQVFKCKRSLEQNRRYWGPAVMGQIAEQAYVNGRRFEKQVWHEQFKRLFIGQLDLPGGGQLGMSSSALNVEEFSLFMQQVEAFAATELGVVFYDPA